MYWSSALLLTALATLAGPVEPPRAALTFRGNVALDAAHPRAAAGVPPAAGKGTADRWATLAAERIVRYYDYAGYPYARVWKRVSEDGAEVTFVIDEGRMHSVELVGSGLVDRLALRELVQLPNGILHAPTLKAGLTRLRESQGFRNVYYEIVDTSDLGPTGVGQLAARRALYIYVIETERNGWHADAHLSPRFGPLVTGGWARIGLAGEDDRLAIDVALAAPYRRYSGEEARTFRWVHGALDLGYRLPAFGGGSLALSADNTVQLSRDARDDVGYGQLVTLRYQGLVSLRWLDLAAGVDGWVGVGASTIRHIDSDGSAPPDDAHRFEARLGLDVALSEDVRRTDERDFVRIVGRLALDQLGQLVWGVELEGQLVIDLDDHHQLRVGTSSIALFGDIRSWDEEPLAGPNQRVFFSNRYWVSRVARVSAAYRLKLGRFRVGVFHDLSVFEDDRAPGGGAALANGFGPSAHLVLFRLLTLNIFYGFGFAPSGFSHNGYFSVSTIF